MAAPESERVRVRRGASKARYDLPAVTSVLDAGLDAHVAFVADQQPYCLPMLYARVEERVLIHGSRASRLMRALAGGAPACLTVTIIRGLVLARSAFEHSANYESVIAFGRFTPVDDAAKRAALETFTESLVPGRWREVRQPTVKELSATSVLAMPLAEAAVKLRTGPPTTTTRSTPSWRSGPAPSRSKPASERRNHRPASEPGPPCPRAWQR
jgi:uncharacterized protein